MAITTYQIVQADTAAELTTAVQAQIDLGLASGTVTITGVATADQTVTVGADTYTWKASAASALQVTLSADVTVAAANLAAKINSNSVSCTATSALGVVTIRAIVLGAAPVLTETTSNLTVSGSGTLTASTTPWQPSGGVAVNVGFDNGQLARHQKLTQAMTISA